VADLVPAERRRNTDGGGSWMIGVSGQRRGEIDDTDRSGGQAVE
jgi:hypothetical protein